MFGIELVGETMKSCSQAKSLLPCFNSATLLSLMKTLLKASVSKNGQLSGRNLKIESGTGGPLGGG